LGQELVSIRMQSFIDLKSLMSDLDHQVCYQLFVRRQASEHIAVDLKFLTGLSLSLRAVGTRVFCRTCSRNNENPVSIGIGRSGLCQEFFKIFALSGYQATLVGVWRRRNSIRYGLDMAKTNSVVGGASCCQEARRRHFVVSLNSLLKTV